jgi:hypothetical protein
VTNFKADTTAFLRSLLRVAIWFRRENASIADLAAWPKRRFRK